MATPRRVLSLIRVSGKPQIDRTGIPRQKESIEHICQDHNLIVETGDKYSFEGLSGASVDKFPEYMAMLDRLKDAKIAGIVFADVSRLFRPEFVDQLGLSKPFRVNGKLMFYEDGILDLRKDRDMSLFIEEAMKAGAYRKRMLKNTLWGRNERRNHGDCKSDPLPRGVKFVPHERVREELVTGHFEYTPEACLMIDAFNRVIAGESYSKITRDLGLYSPTQLRAYLRSHWWVGEKASTSQRTKAGLKDDGTEYTGYRAKREVPIVNPANGLAHRCERCNVHFPPLIPRATFDAVQTLLDRTEKQWVRTTEQLDESPCIGIGVLTCSRCSRKLYTKPKRNGYYYRCSSHNNGNVPCGAPHLHQAEVDDVVRACIREEMKDQERIKRLAPEAPRNDIALLEKQKTTVEVRLDGLYAKLDDPRWDQSRITKNIGEATQQATDINRLLATASKGPSKASVDATALLQRFKHFARLSFKEQRAAIQRTFTEIVVNYDDEAMTPCVVSLKLRPQPTA